MRIKFTTLLLSVSILAFSQKEDYIWLMGGFYEADSSEATSIVDFNYSPPLKEYVFEFPSFFQTNTSISTPDGNLLFYTNGVNFYNADHEIVANGEEFQSSDLYPLGYWMIQGGLIFPYPGHPSQYIFILCDDTAYTDGVFTIHGCYPITYSVIEMNGTGGIVTEKKIPFSTDTLHYNQLQGIQHANGRDWWLVSAPYSQDNIYRKFLLTPEGIALHDIQPIGEPYWKQWGQGAVSPNGEWVAYYNLSTDGSPNYAFYVDLLQFDRCTGELSNHVQMIYPQEGATGGIAISPDSKVLYVSDGEEIYQFDLTATNIKASRQQVAWYDGFLDEWVPSHFGLMKLAPDGKIYICSTTIGTIYMHTIEQPNVLGIGCNIKQHSFILPTRNNRSVPHHPTYRLGPLAGSPCDTIDFTPVEEVEKERAVRIYPNPAIIGSKVNIEVDLPSNKTADFILYDALGKKVSEETMPTTDHHRLSLKGLAMGMYFYDIFSEGKRIAAGKLVVGR